MALLCNGVARKIAQVMLLNNTGATGSHKAHMHGPGRRTAIISIQIVTYTYQNYFGNQPAAKNMP